MNNVQRINRCSEQNSSKSAIIKTLLYFDIFQYPLTATEIQSFSQKKDLSEKDSLDNFLQSLVEDQLIYRIKNFYLLKNEPALVQRRLEGNERAGKMLHVARKVAKFISWFPFVRAVMLSGSISKGYMDKSSDIDYFIITAPGMLWFTRTLLVLFKRIFLFNSHKYFCVNYFIDTNNLEIEEKNLYTAIECITLVPVYGEKYYEDFQRSNSWTFRYFPNSRQNKFSSHRIKEKRNFLKQVIEMVFSNGIGRSFDRLLMRLTYRRWKKLFSTRFSKNDFEVAFKTKEYASKNHPNFYQKKILELYSRKIRDFEEENNVYINKMQA